MHWIVELICIAGVLVTFNVVARAWSLLPEKIPIHFGISDKPDNWGRKVWIVMMPVLSVLVWFCMMIVPAAAPPVSGNTSWMMWLCQVDVSWMFAYITWRWIKVALGEAEGLGLLWIAFLIPYIGFFLLIPRHAMH